MANSVSLEKGPFHPTRQQIPSREKTGSQAYNKQMMELVEMNFERKLSNEEMMAYMCTKAQSTTSHITKK